MTVVIKEGMQDTEMSMWESFRDNVSSMMELGESLSTKEAADIVAYRERTSVLDHRLKMIAEALLEGT